MRKKFLHIKDSSFLKYLKQYFHIGLSVSLAVLLINYVIGYLMLNDGFTVMEFALYAIIPAIVLLGVMVTLGVYVTSNAYDEMVNIHLKRPNYFLELFAIVLSVFACSTVLDLAFSHFVDNTLSLEYANQLRIIVEKSGSEEQLKSMDIFELLPPFLQNYVTNIIGLLIGASIAIGIARKIKSSVKKQLSLY